MANPHRAHPHFIQILQLRGDLSFTRGLIALDTDGCLWYSESLGAKWVPVRQEIDLNAVTST